MPDLSGTAARSSECARTVKDGELQYLVANIRQDKGKRFASKHGVPHVTLLLFDGAGKHSETLSGPNTADNLETAFRRHLERRPQS